MFGKHMFKSILKKIEPPKKFLKTSHAAHILTFAFLHHTALAVIPTGDTEVDKNYHLYMKFREPEAKFELIEQGRGAYKHFFKCESQPTLGPQESYQAYLQRIENWVRGGFSQAIYIFVDSQGLSQALDYHAPIDKAPRYPHQVKFRHMSDDKERHETIIAGQQYFKTFDDDVVTVGELLQIRLPHILCCSSVDHISDYLHYAFSTVSLAKSLSQTYTFPSLGLTEHDLRYDQTFTVIEGGEIKTLALKASPEPDQGYYCVKMREQEQGSFLHSTGEKLYLARKMKIVCKRVNEDLPQEYVFKYVQPTEHLLQVQSPSNIDHPSGFLPQGTHQYKNGGWVKISQTFDVEGAPLHISGPNLPYFESMVLGPHGTSFQAVRDLESFSQASLVPSFNFSGHVFKHHPDQNLDELLALRTLLRRSTHLVSLILSKEDKTVSYDDLVETLLLLTNLKVLDVTNGLISKENFRRLTSKLGLQVIGAPAN